MIVWITGLAGAGKTTLGRAVYSKWKAQDPATVLIDGDEIREIFRHDIGDAPYSVEGRRVNAHRISELCAWLDRQQINVVCCILSIFEEDRDLNRERYSKYLEVLLTASHEALGKRRQLYDDAKSGKMINVVGVDIDYVPPRRPHLTYKTDNSDLPVDMIADDLFRQINRRL